MPHLRYHTQDIQSGLRYLVLLQIALLVSELVVLFVFPVPLEVTAAVEVMTELEVSEPSLLILFISGTVVVVLLVLLLWSWWQLYHLDQRGVAKYLWATGLGLLGVITIPGLGGGWVTTPEDLVNSLLEMSSGAIVCICILCPGIFTTPQTDDGTAPPDTDPKSGEQ